MSESNAKILTLQTPEGTSRDIFENDLDDKSRPIANDINLALALQKEREEIVKKAFIEVRTNEVINSFINDRVSTLEGMLPPVIAVDSKDKKDKS
jgi:hypothetical protein